MDLLVTFSAKKLEIHQIVGSAFFDLNDVVNMERNGWPQCAEVFFLSPALPAVVVPLRR
jgi:hypothetical protein